jgi:crossover junction endodeoxyribonuclease RusA
MADSVYFEVPGAAAPQGSKDHVGGGRMVESSKALKPWRERVAIFAHNAMGGRPPFVGAVAIAIIVRIPNPKSDPRRAYPTKKPDLDKLERAIFDGITGVVIKDDSLIVSNHSRKISVPTDEPACVSISVFPIEGR